MNKYCRYPVGHPTITMNPPVSDFDNYFGMAKVVVEPPRDLYFPVLPVRIDQKLIFPLCRTCASSHNQDSCVCSAEERQLTGTWCTPEINLAISKGNKNGGIHT